MRQFCARLDAEAFEEIVSRFTSPALAAAGQILSDRALAEDAVQEAFLRVVRGRGKYRPSRPFSSWFYAVLRNVCTDMLRRRGRQAKLMEEIAARRAARSPASGDGADASDLLAGLPARDRAVLTLRIVHDLPFRDVAAVLGISEAAAKKRGQRALRKLRAAWTRSAGVTPGGYAGSVPSRPEVGAGRPS